MIRYVWNHNDGKHIYSSPNFSKGEKILVPASREPVFVNILERKEQDEYTASYHVKLFYSDGSILEGWVSSMSFLPIDITNKDELFDGRFNQ